MQDNKRKEKGSCDEVHRVKKSEEVSSIVSSGKEQQDKKGEEEGNTCDDCHVNLPKAPFPLVPAYNPNNVKRNVNKEAGGDDASCDYMQSRKGVIKWEDVSKDRIAKSSEKEARGKYDDEGGVEVEGVARASCQRDVPAHVDSVWVLILRVEP